jgi:hypothetical protein
MEKSEPCLSQAFCGCAIAKDYYFDKPLGPLEFAEKIIGEPPGTSSEHADRSMVLA